MTYAKLFSSLLASSLMSEEMPTRWVFVTMLVMADRDGRVEASVPGLAHFARVTVAEAEKALQTLAAPDPHSRTKDHDGRRIAPAEGGWLVLNYETYRDKGSPEERREKDRLRQERKRERDAASRDRHGPSRSVTRVPPSGSGSGSGSGSVPISRKRGRAAALDTDPGFAQFWEAFGKKVGKADAAKAWARLRPDAALAATIAAAAAAYAAATPEAQYRKHPSRWLAGRGWEDELPKPSAKTLNPKSLSRDSYAGQEAVDAL